jgi:hypothetical protein
MSHSRTRIKESFFQYKYRKCWDICKFKRGREQSEELEFDQLGHEQQADEGEQIVEWESLLAVGSGRWVLDGQTGFREPPEGSHEHGVTSEEFREYVHLVSVVTAFDARDQTPIGTKQPVSEER